MAARVLVVQSQPAFGEVEANLDRVEALLAPHARADLVVLPELFATGYAFRDRAEADALAEPFPDGPTARRLLAWSARLGGMVVGGFAERRGDRLHNAAAVVAAGRPVHVYRKIHLFGFEPEVFEPGEGDLPVLEHEGLRVGVMVCFDWIFPEAARCLALGGADVIAHPSNLVLPWCQRAMPVRALENGVYTATANRVGVEVRPPRPRLEFTGGSLVAGPRGEEVARAPTTGEHVLVADVDEARARDKRLASGNDPMAERRPARYRALTEGPRGGA